GSRCVPMMAHGQLVGLLVLVAGDERQEQLLASLGSFPETVADQIALAVANVRLRDRLRQQSLRDQLTGLYNRRFFDDWLAKQLSQVRRSRGRIGLAMLDLDHFKRFNDTYGHMVADRLLVSFAEMLGQVLREEDVVCRWGGEEFLLAMPGASPQEVREVIQRIQRHLSRLEVRDDEGIRISPTTLSAGIACCPDHARGHEALLFKADAALYQAKNSGRNRCVITGEESTATAAATPLHHVA
ncbi:MAG: sensor domain-containing diguanylate cyclase, partial [Myxococcota bacterium]